MLWGLLAPMAIRAIKVPIGNSTAERNFAGYSAWANRLDAINLEIEHKKMRGFLIANNHIL